MTKASRLRIFIVLIVALCSSTLSAETVASGLQSALTQAGSGNTPSQGDPSSSDRKGNYNQSANSSNAGMMEAMAAGAALTSIGVPMTLSPELPTQIAGYTLLGMAATEFAQGAASGNAGSGNSNNKNLVSQDKAPSDSQLQFDQSNKPNSGSGSDSGSNSNSSSLIPKSIQDQLAANGVDPQALADGIKSGTLTNPDDVARAMGASGPFSEDDKAQAQQIVDQQLASGLPGTGIPKALSFDDSGKPQSDGAAPADGAQTPASKGSSMASADMPQLSVSSQMATTAAGKLGANPLATALGLAGISDDSLKAMLMSSGTPAPVTDPEVLRATIDQSLGQIGVGLASTKLNIFQRAHNRVSSFGRWRKKWIKDHRLARR
jgi:hypothetical protein